MRLCVLCERGWVEDTPLTFLIRAVIRGIVSEQVDGGKGVFAEDQAPSSTSSVAAVIVDPATEWIRGTRLLRRWHVVVVVPFVVPSGVVRAAFASAVLRPCDQCCPPHTHTTHTHARTVRHTCVSSSGSCATIVLQKSVQPSESCVAHARVCVCVHVCACFFGGAGGRPGGSFQRAIGKARFLFSHCACPSRARPRDAGQTSRENQTISQRLADWQGHAPCRFARPTMTCVSPAVRFAATVAATLAPITYALLPRDAATRRGA